MTNNERLLQHNAELREAIEVAESLPDVGSGGITPTGTISITENGSYEVTNYATAEVNVPTPKPVTEELSVTENGEYTPNDGVDGFSKVTVSVPAPVVPTQEKTVEITENGTVSVMPDEGYALSKVTANVNVPIPDGYIKPSGTLEVSENGTHDVTAYASVSVNVPTGGGGDTSIEDGLVTRTLTVYRNERVESVGSYLFYNSASLQSIVLPNVKIIGTYAFANCAKLTAVVFPKVTTFFGRYAFNNCTQLTTADFPSATTLYDGSGLFDGCSSLTSLILRRTQYICSHPRSGGFTGTPIRSGAGYIYVPRALVDSYKSATNWSAYGDQFRALEDYTVDGTTTGALDPTKI